MGCGDSTKIKDIFTPGQLRGWFEHYGFFKTIYWGIRLQIRHIEQIPFNLYSYGLRRSMQAEVELKKHEEYMNLDFWGKMRYFAEGGK